ncbi:hypothetical protein CSOJ01_11667 [Colletotrichum sojae]|uniref:Uncharacterized protein n=1 Tax=Colletotrichum sojae TaxID=2175907 RepID=A0A8H6MNH6_9PEZI|nr:hypothetical protein CSOJ01_11667 [Colletotrichum sojae]
MLEGIKKQRLAANPSVVFLDDLQTATPGPRLIKKLDRESPEARHTSLVRYMSALDEVLNMVKHQDNGLSKNLLRALALTVIQRLADGQSLFVDERALDGTDRFGSVYVDDEPI